MSSPQSSFGASDVSWKNDALVVFGLQVLVIAAIVATLGTILPETRPPLRPYEPDPSPLGYTWSLALFILPLGWLIIWLLKTSLPSPAVRAFVWTTGILIPIWIMLDVVCALSFFNFENEGSVLGFRFWGVTWKDGFGWEKTIPIEEVIFYVTGFLAIILFYMWADHRWLARYRREVPNDSLSRPEIIRKLVKRMPLVASIAIALVALVWLYKKFGPHAYHDGFPGYFLFLVACGIAPCIWLLPVAGPVINWKAFSFSAFFFGLIFLFWEGALAIPYGWWGYENDMMMGILIHGFGGLPLEAALLWVTSIWTNVTLYESFRTWLSAKP